MKCSQGQGAMKISGFSFQGLEFSSLALPKYMDSLQVCWVKRHQNPCGVLPGPKDRDWDPVRLVTQMWRGLGLDGVHPPGRRFAFEVTISWNLRKMCVFGTCSNHGKQTWTPNFRNTVDGRNAAPVDMVNIPLFTRFYTSQVVQDFFHQQYV